MGSDKERRPKEHHAGEAERAPRRPARQEEPSRSPEAPEAARPEAGLHLQDSLGNLAALSVLELPGQEGSQHDGLLGGRGRTTPGLVTPPHPAALAPPWATQLQYGADDDDPWPIPPTPGETPLTFNRGGRGNRARLEAMREAERISPILEAIPPALRSDPAADRGRDQRCSGDAVFQAPMDAWEDLRLLLNRSVDPEDLVDLPGPGDPLDRSRALACFLAPRSVDPLGRALMEAVSEVPALTFTGGYLEATARLATLTTLGLAVEARGTHLLMDRAVQVALAHYAVEEVLEVAGDISESVPPAPVLHQRITGAEPGPLPASLSPSPAAARLLLPALQHAAQVIPTPTPRPPPMEPPRHLPPDGTPESVVEQAILSSEPDQAPGDALRCLVEDQEALLAAGGRAQVEMAAAALAAGRHLAPQAQALLKRAFREFRGAALRLLEVRARLEQGDNPPLPALLFKETTEAAGAMEHARRSLLLSLAALVERDAQGL